jgi:TRAP-type C4-dicarboxylate transport system permease small subunit
VERLHNVEKVITRILKAVISLCFFIILLLTIVLVTLRYGFNTTIIGGNEAMEYLFIYTTAIGAAVSIGKREHIKITFLIDKLPAQYRKIIDIMGLLLVGFINGVMIWFSFPWIKSVGNHESPVLRIPNWIIQVIIPISCSLAVLYCLYQILLTIRKQEMET